MVASAHPLPPGRARGSRYELVPAGEVKRIVRAYGAPLFLPRRLPAGFIFSRWQVLPNGYGHPSSRRLLLVTFGRDGPSLAWSVYAGVDKFGLDCPEGHSRFTPPRPTLIDGRRIFFLLGIHGASVWTCIPRQAVGNTKPIEVELWYDIRVDSPAMRRLARRMVGTSRLIRTGSA
jgi:hypothetical protein